MTGSLFLSSCFDFAYVGHLFVRTVSRPRRRGRSVGDQVLRPRDGDSTRQQYEPEVRFGVDVAGVGCVAKLFQRRTYVF